MLFKLKHSPKDAKMISLILVMLLLMPASAPAKSVNMDPDDVVSFSPQIICADLMGIPKDSSDIGYDRWRQFEKCIGYFHSVDGTYR